MGFNDKKTSQENQIEEIKEEIKNGLNFTHLEVSRIYHKYKDEFFNKHFDPWMVGMSEKSCNSNSVINSKLHIKNNLCTKTINKSIDGIDKALEQRKLNEQDIEDILKNNFEKILHEEALNWYSTRKQNNKF